MSEQRIALVTGAGQGIGAAIARHLGAAGCIVVLVDINSQQLALLSEQLDVQGIDNLPMTLDVTNKAGIEKSVAEVLER